MFTKQIAFSLHGLPRAAEIQNRICPKEPNQTFFALFHLADCNINLSLCKKAFQQSNPALAPSGTMKFFAKNFTHFCSFFYPFLLLILYSFFYSFFCSFPVPKFLFSSSNDTSEYFIVNFLKSYLFFQRFML